MKDGKDLEGSGSGQFKVLYQNFPGGTEETMKNISQKSQCCKNLNKALPLQNKTTALPLDQPVQVEWVRNMAS
jgi:hypothetical protein